MTVETAELKPSSFWRSAVSKSHVTGVNLEMTHHHTINQSIPHSYIYIYIYNIHTCVCVCICTRMYMVSRRVSDPPPPP